MEDEDTDLYLDFLAHKWFMFGFPSWPRFERPPSPLFPDNQLGLDAYYEASVNKCQHQLQSQEYK